MNELAVENSVREDSLIGGHNVAWWAREFETALRNHFGAGWDDDHWPTADYILTIVCTENDIPIPTGEEESRLNELVFRTMGAEDYEPQSVIGERYNGYNDKNTI